MKLSYGPSSGDYWPRPYNAAAKVTQRHRVKTSKEEQGTTSAPPSTGAAQEKGEKIKEGLESLIDQIDEVLEENAEEFVRNYVQRGGQ